MDVGGSQWWLTASTMTQQHIWAPPYPNFPKFGPHLHGHISEILGCAFRFLFRFLPGVIFWNPRNSAAFLDSIGTHVGIKSFQGKINLVQNSGLRNSGQNSGGKDTYVIRTYL